MMRAAYPISCRRPVRRAIRLHKNDLLHDKGIKRIEEIQVYFKPYVDPGYCGVHRNEVYKKMERPGREIGIMSSNAKNDVADVLFCHLSLFINRLRISQQILNRLRGKHFLSTVYLTVIKNNHRIAIFITISTLIHNFFILLLHLFVYRFHYFVRGRINIGE
jgi:hypothetical protein